MNQKIFIGIDPGLDGAVCVMMPGQEILFHDTPTLKIGKKGKREYNLAAMADTLILYQKQYVRPGGSCSAVTAGLEAIHSMPGQAVTAMFTMGRGLGIWQGILAALQIPYEMIPPQRWKKALMDGMPKEKDSSRVVAMRLFPHIADQLVLKKHHNRADALLIAEYERRTNGG